MCVFITKTITFTVVQNLRFFGLFLSVELWQQELFVAGVNVHLSIMTLSVWLSYYGTQLNSTYYRSLFWFNKITFLKSLYIAIAIRTHKNCLSWYSMNIMIDLVFEKSSSLKHLIATDWRYSLVFNSPENLKVYCPMRLIPNTGCNGKVQHICSFL